MDDTVIEFKDIGFQYFSQKEPTLHDINLKVHKGEKILIAGPSGSGKSTLGNCLNGLIPFAYKGEIKGSLKVDGIETKDASIFQLSQHVGTVLQDSDGQFIGLNVGEDIAFALENDNVPQGEMKERVHRIAEMVNMDSFLANNPHELSGGQKQRASLAGVMVGDAQILLFDEPLANLDPKTGKTAIELIDQIAATGKTVIIIEHRVEDVLWRKVDRIVLIDEGTVLADDTPDKVLASGILMEHGVREPLYLAACRYADVPVSEALHPESVDTLDMKTVSPYVQKWYSQNYVRSVAEEKKPLLTVDHISYSYDGVRPVLQDVNVVIHEGEMLSIVGKNGAGKTTLSSIICGFIKPDEGRILLNGEDLS